MFIGFLKKILPIWSNRFASYAIADIQYRVSLIFPICKKIERFVVYNENAQM